MANQKTIEKLEHREIKSAIMSVPWLTRNLKKLSISFLVLSLDCGLLLIMLQQNRMTKMLLTIKTETAFSHLCQNNDRLEKYFEKNNMIVYTDP